MKSRNHSPRTNPAFSRKSAWLLVALLASSWSAGANANRLADIKERGTLICGTQNASSPYGYQDPRQRKYVGYDVDICQALASELGVKLQHKPLSTEARIPEVKMGRVDIVAGSVAWLPKRAEEVDFSLQYLQGNIKVLVKKDAGIKTLADLAGKKVCASSGSSSAAIAQKTLPKAEVLTYQNISQCYLGLQNDKVQAMSAGELVLLRFANDSQKTETPAVLLDEPTATEHIGIIMNKGEPELKAAVDNALTSIEKSGELDKIFNKWLGDDSIYKLKRTFKVEPVAQLDSSTKN
ncbi:ABC transporter substrate-binding protein [Advenella mimigardefordensis]|uniref:Putative periplasmic amino acid-binding protein n=1 Tax=Advenella mimigardefordensis (strain DSM 17166 / LMG 22922 / DPN7) TaxID=1247726 RepID=W0PIN5_ADVMD|nr:ABC transporter substrate-binding protein [Advenella mimigardefordensis]AHG65802.1 putative periplasmic amino acid-binding protein [Advenella mimigardefordensis DPN7]